MSKLDYVISYETMMLETASHPEYLTKITDTNGVVYSTRPARTLIKGSALANNHSIKGHLEIVKNSYPNMKKIPLMINTALSILMIPTTSPNGSSCKWLNFIQIKHYRKMNEVTKVHFRNGAEIEVPVSYYIFDRQMSKATKLLGIYLSQTAEYKVKTEEEKLIQLKEFMVEYLKKNIG
ncbi:competence protein ComK [Bacillus sp. EAC]|uniref:competence protein ComK n=1 Tax=Bacillus sp. EAC TaxID=1978338 RepID=UPI000B43FBF6|nr:competence protein ComK [Bacillus sp. EAC]